LRPAHEREFRILAEAIIACERCPRLREYCAEIARVKRKAFLDWNYWGRPVPPFGDPDAQMLILGLAPAAHGANRTGRMFTGDRSGDFLFRALWQTGFASQPRSEHRGDGLSLRGAYISASVRCAPPDNKPLPVEIRNCRPYLERELELLRRLKVVVALGQIAFQVYLGLLKEHGEIRSAAAFRFGHNVEHVTGTSHPVLISSYHPSQQNTSTGKLTESMLRDVFLRARSRLVNPPQLPQP
jgi:uracil-DNA glycosylase family 4